MNEKQYRKPGPDLIGARHMEHGILVEGTAYECAYPIDPSGKLWLACDASGGDIAAPVESAPSEISTPSTRRDRR